MSKAIQVKLKSKDGTNPLRQYLHDVFTLPTNLLMREAIAGGHLPQGDDAAVVEIVCHDGDDCAVLAQVNVVFRLQAKQENQFAPQTEVEKEWHNMVCKHQRRSYCA